MSDTREAQPSIHDKWVRSLAICMLLMFGSLGAESQIYGEAGPLSKFFFLLGACLIAAYMLVWLPVFIEWTFGVRRNIPRSVQIAGNLPESVSELPQQKPRVLTLPEYEVECNQSGCDWSGAYHTHRAAMNALTAHKKIHKAESPIDKNSHKYPVNPFSDRDSGYVYLLKEHSKGHYKIGYTQNPANRYETFGLKLPFYPEYIHLIPCQNMKQAEAYLHSIFRGRRVEGTEWFNLTPTDVAYFKNLKELDLRGGK